MLIKSKTRWLYRIKRAWLACGLILCAGTVNADPIRYDNAPLAISDGLNTYYPYKLIISGGSLVDNGDGTITITVGTVIPDLKNIFNTDGQQIYNTDGDPIFHT